MFFKAVLSKDIRGLTKPWEVDYKNIKVVRHTIDYNGEKIEMLAMAFPLKDNKHVIAYYEFSKPVQGVKIRSYLFDVGDDKVKTQAISTNGQVTILSSCTHECSSDADCSGWEFCGAYCCSHGTGCLLTCCGAAGAACIVGCLGNPACIVGCAAVSCPTCLLTCCNQYGTTCEPWPNV